MAMEFKHMELYVMSGYSNHLVLFTLYFRKVISIEIKKSCFCENSKHRTNPLYAVDKKYQFIIAIQI